jgi:tRNA-modifying protein YgfZ
MSATAFELPPHILLRLRGERALAFLQDVCAQDVAGLAPGEGAHTAFLDPKGRVLADALVLAGADEVLLVAEATCADGLERAVSRVAPLAGVEVATRTVAVARVVGGDWAEALPSNEHDWSSTGGGIVVRVLWGGDGHDVIASSFEELRSILADAGVRSGDPGEAEAARIAAGRPRYGLDVTQDMLVNETPLLDHAVAKDKGCYPGQESVARVRNLGRVRRRLVVMEVAGPPPAPGTAVTLQGDEIGRITSSAPEGEGAIALASLRADVAADEALEVAGSGTKRRS